MSTIKKIGKKDYDTFINIVANAYPGMRIISQEDKKKTRARLLNVVKNPAVHHLGLYRKGRLLGGMALYDFIMNIHSKKTKIGGVGLVAVDLLHKKEKVCKEMIYYFLERYRKKGVSLVALYPFRPDFYRKMGFGYGTKVSQYSFKPSDLPKGISKRHLCFLDKKAKSALKRCYLRFFEQRHGMILDLDHKWTYIFKFPEARIVGYKKGKEILGYVIFTFKKVQEDNWIKHNVIIREFVYENRKIFLELLTFLHTQLDQVNRIVYGTQNEDFHHILFDPRNGSDRIVSPLAHETNTQGIGIMYRVINTKGIFRALMHHNFNNQSCKLNIVLRDGFFKRNEGKTTVHFVKGKPRLKNIDKYDVEIRLDVSHFSSLIMGAVEFNILYDYGLAEISGDKYIDLVNRLFLPSQKPMTTTQF